MEGFGGMGGIGLAGSPTGQDLGALKQWDNGNFINEDRAEHR